MILNLAGLGQYRKRFSLSIFNNNTIIIMVSSCALYYPTIDITTKRGYKALICFGMEFVLLYNNLLQGKRIATDPHNS